MKLWLMKSESAVYSIEDLRRDGITGWEGVRNFEARNYLRSMNIGDQAFFYHSNSKPSGVAGIVEICRSAYPDPTQFDKKNIHYDPKASPERPIWFQVDVRFKKAFSRILSLDELRSLSVLQDAPLFKRSRLSVQPLSAASWQAILRLTPRAMC